MRWQPADDGGPALFGVDELLVPLHHAVPDELAHDAQASGAGHRAAVRGQVAGDDPQQRGLPGAVRADQRDLGALAHQERHIGQQLTPIGQHIAHAGDIHVTHGSILPGRCPRGQSVFRVTRRTR